MLQWFKKYRTLTFEKRTILNTRISIIFNLLMAIGKFALAYFNLAFLVSGIVNVFLMLAKVECFLGETKPEKKSFFYRNTCIAIFLMLAGLQYGFYMGRLIFIDVELTKYNMVVGTIIAFVSFVEIGVAIKGCFNAFGRGHYYRNLKLISLSSALTALALTELAIMSFANSSDTRFIDGIFGVSVGVIIILLGIYVLFAPKISILDKRHQAYYMTEDMDSIDDMMIELTHSKFYGNFVYVAVAKSGMVDGYIFKKKSPIRYWNPIIKVMIIILSEILIFPYAIGGLISYFKSSKIMKILDGKMAEKGCMRIEEIVYDYDF